MGAFFPPPERDEIDAFKERRASIEKSDAFFVDAAFRDILRGDFESAAIHEVMQRRAGTIEEYRRLKDELDAAILAKRHSGAV